MLIARGVTEVGQQTPVKDVFLKSAIFPLLSRSSAKSVSQEMWGIKRLEAPSPPFSPQQRITTEPQIIMAHRNCHRVGDIDWLRWLWQVQLPRYG